MRTPFVLVLPGETNSRLVPMLLIWLSMAAVLPRPTPISAITAATPMIMPEHGQRRAQLVGRQAVQRDPEAFSYLHRNTSTISGSSAISAAPAGQADWIPVWLAHRSSL